MLRPHIQIVNERFISRYGVDRILLLMADHFAAMGARVSFGCLRYNEELFDARTSIVKLPAYGQDIFENVEKFMYAEKIATDGMIAAWLNDKPDLVLIGGWPFFDLAARSPSVGVHSVFIDAGAVPHTGYPETAQAIQQELRRIRAQTLPFIEKILPISNFIRFSQTEQDRCSSQGVRTIHLGANHLADLNLSESSPLVEKLRGLKAAGQKLLLAAGRFETTGYKNSMSAIHVTRGIRCSIPDVTLLVLQQPEYLPIPDDMVQNVMGIGNPSDSELLEIIRLLDLTLTTSLWEGFNLPLVESQHEGCPTLAYACGSHPEVIADPWFLCQSESEMATKAVQILSDATPSVALKNLEAFRDRFPWAKTLAEIWEEIDDLLHKKIERESLTGRRLVFFDVSKCALNSRSFKAIEAARALCANLIHHPSLEVVFTTWDDNARCFKLVDDRGPDNWYNPLTALDESYIRGVEIHRLLMAASQRSTLPPLLLFPMVAPQEVMRPRMDWARVNGLACGVIVHDLTPSLSTTYFPEEQFLGLPDHYRHLLAADIVICNSQSVLDSLLAYAEKSSVSIPEIFTSIEAAAPFDGRVREKATPDLPGESVRIVAFNAFGSNESSRELLKALARLEKRLPHRRISLTLIGFDRDEAKGLPVCSALQWFDKVSGAKFKELIAEAHFSVCPSVTGGIDIVAAESLWTGRPCLCHREGIGIEIARDGGGCLVIDMRSQTMLEKAMACMIEDHALYRRLAHEALTRPLTDWFHYINKIAAALVSGKETSSSTEFVVVDEINIEKPRYGKTIFDQVSKSWNFKKRSRLLAASGLFDAQWYLERYKDVAKSGMDPRLHFLYFGSFEMRDPGPEFSTIGYIALHPDVARVKAEPWVHYAIHGVKEHRSIIAVAEADTRYRWNTSIRTI